jgi:pectin-derived oligosaccharide transport system substrate-binding protein
MKNGISRRQFGQLLGAGAALGAMAGLPSLASAATRLRLIWWGNPDRDRRTNEVVDLYVKENADVAIDPETYAWNDYWPKLATQAAGQNLPDVIQMDYRYIFEYARRGQLADLTPYVGKAIDLSDFDPNQLASGKVDDKLYGISMGANSMTHVYKPAMLESLGLPAPDATKWTIDDYVAMGKEVKGKLPEGLYFSENMAYREPRLETWVRQRGKALYTADGKLGYDLEDLEEYFAFWFQMQEDGLTPPADLQSQAIASGKMEDTMFVTGHAVFDFIHSNQLVAVQKLVPDELNITMIPNQKDGKPGQYLKPSMLISMSASAADPEAAAKLMNFFIADDNAADILLIERGVTGDKSIRERILPKLSETEQKIVSYLDLVGTHVGELPPPPPKNAGELDRALQPAWESVSFRKVDVKTAATDYYEKAKVALERA